MRNIKVDSFTVLYNRMRLFVTCIIDVLLKVFKFPLWQIQTQSHTHTPIRAKQASAFDTGGNAINTD